MGTYKGAMLMNDVVTETPSSLLSILGMARDTIGEVCNMRETMLDITDAYNQELMKHVSILSDPGYADEALGKLSPERQAILMAAIKDMVEMLPTLQLKTISELADEARQDLARLRKIHAKFDMALDGLVP